jgi:Flp pilus assembly protein TadG
MWLHKINEDDMSEARAFRDYRDISHRFACIFGESQGNAALEAAIVIPLLLGSGLIDHSQ